MKSFFTGILLLFTFSCNAQIIELSYGPVSVRGWGNLPKTSKLSASFLFRAAHSHSVCYTPGIRYTHLHSKNSNLRDRFGQRVDGTFNILFFMPASFNISVGKIELLDRIGIGLSDIPFPNKDGLRFNFLLEAGVRIPLTDFFSLSLRYSHISNGYQGQINPGLDNVVVAAGFYF